MPATMSATMQRQIAISRQIVVDFNNRHFHQIAKRLAPCFVFQDHARGTIEATDFPAYLQAWIDRTPGAEIHSARVSADPHARRVFIEFEARRHTGENFAGCLVHQYGEDDTAELLIAAELYYDAVQV